MRWWPWVSRSTFRAVLEAKNEVIAYQREHIQELREALTRPVAVTVTLPKDFAVIQPAIVSAPNKRGKKQGTVPPKFNLADIDERDTVQLGILVNYYLGERAPIANRWEKRQVLQGLLVQIRAAKDARLRERAKAVESGPPEPENVPQHIKEMVESAERGE